MLTYLTCIAMGSLAQDKYDHAGALYCTITLVEMMNGISESIVC